MSFIHYTKPSITDLELSYAAEAAREGWGSKCYEYIEKFERDFSRYLDVDFAIATSSCTGALHMGMHALGVGNGDEVIIANTNWVAIAAPIIHLGANPIFVDILPESWCIDPEQVEKAITKKTKAIVAVHLYGNLCNMNRLLEISNRYSIPLIEDAAEAIGSSYFSKKAGSIGTFGTFSFHGTKTITTGEGGMFVTNDKSIYENVHQLSNHGRGKHSSKQFWPEVVGFKYKMSNIQAAIGCAQLKRINELVLRKKQIFNTYKKKLSDLPLKMNPKQINCSNGYWMPTIVFDESIKLDRDYLINFLNSKGIDARVFFWPLNKTPITGKKAFDQKYISESIHLRSLNLPSYHELKDSEIDYVCKIIREYIESNV